MIKTVTATSVRENFKSMMDHVKISKNPLIVTQRGVPTTVIIDIDVFEDYLTAKDKEFVASIKKARTQYTTGTVFNMADVFAGIT